MPADDGSILCIIPQFSVQASSTSTGLTGETTESTTRQDPGTAEDQSDLSQLNIGNTFTITSNEGNGQINGTLRILIMLTLIALAPTLLIMLTSFTRILIVLHFTRAALNTQTAPPNQVLIGLALFLTFFVMRPTITTIYTEALVPFENGEITQEEIFDEGLQPLREFMYGQTQKKDVTLFLERNGTEHLMEFLRKFLSQALLSVNSGLHLLSAFIFIFRLLSLIWSWHQFSWVWV